MVRMQKVEVKKGQKCNYWGYLQSRSTEMKKMVQASWTGWRRVSGVICERGVAGRVNIARDGGIDQETGSRGLKWSS